MNSMINVKSSQNADYERLRLFTLKAEEYSKEYENSCKRTKLLEKDVESMIKKTNIYESKIDNFLINFYK